jgi:P pilus assembly chaperone PapD
MGDFDDRGSISGVYFTNCIYPISTGRSDAETNSSGVNRDIITPTGSASAQIGISPMVIEVQESEGQSQATINVINNTNTPFRARIYAESFTYEKDKGFNTIPQNSESLVPYLKFSPRELNVPAGVTRRVRLNVQLPPNLPAGEYRSAIFTENLEQQKQTDLKGIVTTITTRIGVTMFVRKGEHAPKLTITTAEWLPAKSQILMTMNNTGKASAYPEVNWTIAQAGVTIKTGRVSATGIVPNSDRTVNINIPKQELKLKPGKYQLSGDLIWGEPDHKTTVPFSVGVNIN